MRYHVTSGIESSTPDLDCLNVDITKVQRFLKLIETFHILSKIGCVKILNWYSNGEWIGHDRNDCIFAMQHIYFYAGTLSCHIFVSCGMQHCFCILRVNLPFSHAHISIHRCWLGACPSLGCLTAMTRRTAGADSKDLSRKSVRSHGYLLLEQRVWIIYHKSLFASLSSTANTSRSSASINRVQSITHDSTVIRYT